LVEIAQGKRRGGMGDDEACVLQADEGDKQADAAGDRCVKRRRDAFDEAAAEAG